MGPEPSAPQAVAAAGRGRARRASRCEPSPRRVSGDTLVHDELAELPRRFADIDLALLHLGGTRLFGVLLTLDAQQGVQALQLLQPRRAMPIHHADDPVFKSSLQEFLAAARAAGLQDKVRVLRPGERFNFTLPAERWH